MKNEVMAKAITGIDDNLISDAENIKKKKSIISLKGVYSLLYLFLWLYLYLYLFLYLYLYLFLYW